MSIVRTAVTLKRTIDTVRTKARLIGKPFPSLRLKLLTWYATTDATLWVAQHVKEHPAQSRPFACLRDSILAMDDINPRYRFVTELLVHETGFDREITADEIVKLRRIAKQI